MSVEEETPDETPVTSEKEHDISTNKEEVDKHEDKDEVASADENLDQASEKKEETGPIDIFARQKTLLEGLMKNLPSAGSEQPPVIDQPNDQLQISSDEE